MRQPLAGLPSWTPALHASVALAARPRGSALLVDMLPARATDPRTLAAMLCFAQVEANVRLRPARWPVRRRGYVVRERLGETGRSDVELRGFVEGERARRMSLFGNNCYDFEEALLRFLLDGDD